MKTHRHHHACGQVGLPELTAQLRRSARITGPRKQVLAVLGAHPHPLTRREIFERMPGPACDLATVYRSMHLLEETGLVQRYDFGDGVVRYELTRDDKAHHHHLICTRCSEVVELEDCFPVELERKIASRSGFKSVSHRLEFFGVCPGCQQ